MVGIGLLVAVKCVCLCGPLKSPRQAFLDAPVVFRGVVVNVADVEAPGIPRSLRYTFRVERWRKGGGADTVSVTSGQGAGDCGFVFREGRRYTVYARQTAGGLATSICDMPAAFAERRGR